MHNVSTVEDILLDNEIKWILKWPTQDLSATGLVIY